MTVIAWDGKTLAADKQASSQGLLYPVTKIRRLKNGSLAGVAGDFVIGLEMFEWLDGLRSPADLPKRQIDEDKYAVCLVITKERAIYVYENSHIPILVEQEQFAIGSGRDFALAVMHLGGTASDAVRVTSKLASGCGLGIDELDLL